MSSGATYSPGAWFALVSPSAAVLVDPELPSERLDELWQVIQRAGGVERARAVLYQGSPRVPSFALAMVEPVGVQLVVRGRVEVTVQSRGGRVRRVVPPGDDLHEELVATTDTLWFVRPASPADGVALPIVGAAVLADVLAWQPMSGLDGWAVVASGWRSAQGAGGGPTTSDRQRSSTDRDRISSDRPAGSVPEAAPEPPLPAAAGAGPRVDVPVDADSGGEPPTAAGVARAEGRRLTPDAIRAATGRTTAGLGSHRRRRYGAWDWSVPERSGSAERPGYGSEVPQTRNGSGEEGPAAAEEEPAVVAPVPAAESVGFGHSVLDTSVHEDTEVHDAVADAASQVEDVSQVEHVPQAASSSPAASAPTPSVAPTSPKPPTDGGARRYGVLEFSDGRTIEVTGPVVIGRAPSQASQAGDRSAQLVALTGAGRAISRNHVRVDVGLNGLFVVDLGSRNGSTLQAEGREPTRLEAWLPYPLLPGMRLTFADASCVLREG